MEALEFIEEVTTNVADIQRTVLEEILSKNVEVKYLNLHGLNKRTYHKSYKELIPMVTYKDIKAEIEQVAKGDQSPILCSNPISFLTRCSGKLMPMTEDELHRRSMVFNLVDPLVRQYCSNFDEGKTMFFLHVEPETPHGLPIPIRSAHYLLRGFYKVLTNTSPEEIIVCSHPYQSMYAQVLCGLCQREEVTRVGAVSPSGLIRVINFLEENWSSLDYDIRTGVLHANLKDGCLRKVVKKVLKPDPKLAYLIKSELSQKNKGVLKKLWPNTKYLEVIATENLGKDVARLNFYRKELPVLFRLYAPWEGAYGVNVFPLDKLSEASYALIPNLGYYEFLKVGTNDLVELVDLKIGEEYHLLLTTYSGL